MAGALTGDSATAGSWDTTRALIGLRRSLARNSPGGSPTAPALRLIGLALAIATLLLGLIPFDDPDGMVDLLATLYLGWLIGWVMGPILVRGAGQGLRPEWFALLPIPPRRLATGLLGASFAGVAPVITLVAFGCLPVAAARLGVLPVLVAVPAMLLELVLVVLLSRVVVAVLSATLSTRHGQELGGLLMAAVIALASGGWSLAAIIGQQLAVGPEPGLSTALRVLPSGWGPVAVAAADRSDWALVVVPLLGLAALSGLLLLAWAALLTYAMRRPAGRAAGSPRRAGIPGARRGGWGRLLPAGPTGAVIAKELRAWRRDTGRILILVIALLISGLNLAVPALAFDLPAGLPWVGLVAALIVSMGAINVYGDEGTALWLTRMVPGVERADVRGRQAAWLLAIAPPIVVLTVALTALSGQAWAWVWMLATLPAVLGGAAGLIPLLSVTMPVRQKDPRRRTGPFDTSDDPNAAGALAGTQYLMLALATLTAVPAGVLVIVGDAQDLPLLQAAGVLVGIATGVLLYLWGGRLAAQRLADRGAELMDLLHVGPQAVTRGARESPAAELTPARSALVGGLWTVGIICIVPQGLVPIVFRLVGVEEDVRVWFLARYVSPGLQFVVAGAFIAAGLLVIWWAESLRRAAQPRRAAPPRRAARPGR